MNTQTDIHNKVAGEVVRTIVNSPLEAGGSFTDALVILESVVLGVVLVGVRSGGGGGDKLLDELVLHVKERLTKLERLN
jgi:hypothetical protein